MKDNFEPQRTQNSQRIPDLEKKEKSSVFFVSSVVNLHWLWVMPCLLLALWLGARGLDADAIWSDEYYSLYDSGGVDAVPRSLADIWTRVGERNPWHAPGFFILLSGWEHLVGTEPPALRAFALLVGLLAVAWTYRLGRDLAAPQVGLYAAAVLSVSAFFVHYLHELRMYTLFALWTAFTLWVYLKIMSSPSPPPHRNGEGSKGRGVLLWLGLLVGAVGMLYTHYFAALPLAAVGVYHVALLFKPPPLTPRPHEWGEKPSPLTPLPQGEGMKRRWWGVVGVLALAGVLFLPWMSTLLAGLELAAEADWIHVRALNTPEALEQLAYLYGNGFPPLFVLTLIIALFALRNQTRGARDIWLLAVATLLAILVVNAILQIMHSGRVRYLMSLAPLVALLIGLGIAELRRLPTPGGQALPAIALALWLASGVWNSARIDFANLDGAQYIYPLHRLARELKPLAQPRDGVISFLPEWLPEWVHQDIARFYLRTLPVDHRIVETTDNLDKRDQDRQIMLDFSTDRERVWVAYMPEHAPVTVEQFITSLSESLRRCDTPLDSDGLRVEQFTRSAVCCISEQTSGRALASFSSGIALVDVTAVPAEVDHTLALTLGWWIPADVPPDTFSVGVQVLDADGTLAAQQDYGLLAQRFDCRPVEISLVDLAPGEYTLIAVVYAWQTGERLRVGDQDHAMLGTFTVR